MSVWTAGNHFGKTLLKQVVLVAALLPFWATSQHSDTLHFALKIGKESLELHKEYALSDDTFRLETVRFYVSNLQLLRNNKTISQCEGLFFLADAEESSSLDLIIPVTKQSPFDEIIFDLGIDSAVNVAGVQGGVLDPVNGMYWSWQSGYIYAKIEGWSPESTARKQEFNYHLGGYLSPNEARKTIRLKLSEPTCSTNVDVQLLDFLKGVDLVNKPMVMSPGETAMRLSELLSNCFSVNP